jgi:hypothetical protein
MIAFIVALLLAVLTGQAVPAPVAATHAAPAPAAVAPTPSHGRAPAGSAHAGVPTQRPAAPATVAPSTPTNGQELQGPVMCTDPISCPTS